ncbi:hypothetical protein QL285_011075 [Trifolium repens]|jgi:hypothetical protein|nr:hypothetical protein QL285_011075 [Trifolium repens]
MKEEFTAMTEAWKNAFRNMFRENIRKKILHPEANKGPVLNINDDDPLMLEAIQAVEALDAHNAAQQQAEQQNSEGSAEEKCDSPATEQQAEQNS